MKFRLTVKRASPLRGACLPLGSDLSKLRPRAQAARNAAGLTQEPRAARARDGETLATGHPFRGGDGGNDGEPRRKIVTPPKGKQDCSDHFPVKRSLRSFAASAA